MDFSRYSHNEAVTKEKIASMLVSLKNAKADIKTALDALKDVGFTSNLHLLSKEKVSKELEELSGMFDSTRKHTTASMERMQFLLGLALKKNFDEEDFRGEGIIYDMEHRPYDIGLIGRAETFLDRCNKLLEAFIKYARGTKALEKLKGKENEDVPFCWTANIRQEMEKELSKEDDLRKRYWEHFNKMP
jgi:hypothetical protein